MEVLAGLGLLATEVFKYNRDNYQFDQDQRFEREELRIKMQVERFSLFRQDIRDLVELTVSKMDLYHMVGALFLRMMVIYYTEGFFEAAAPPFLLVFYYFSVACAFIYLILAVWLAMHASISSHSYGTRLLTRFVRLPIPGSAQLDVLNARLADFERQGVSALRVPFLQRNGNRWQQRAQMEQIPESAAAGSSAAASGAGPQPATQVRSAKKVIDDMLGDGEFAYGGATDLAGKEDELLHAVEFRTQRHVQLFRSLQARWQCYDAYARVCMSLGVRQMLQAIGYYVIGFCMVDNYWPHVAYVVTITFQALAMTISVLDIHGLPCYGNLDLSLIGMLPAFVACVILSLAKRQENGDLKESNRYLISLAMYPLEICWFELLHWVASPTDVDESLPRHFRAVLFMDVFGDIDDPTEASNDAGPNSRLTAQDRTRVQHKAAAAEAALVDAQAVKRRWEAAAHSDLSLKQRRQLSKFTDGLADTINVLQDVLDRHRLNYPEEDTRTYDQLSLAEREQDPYAGTVLGPFQYFTGAGLAAQYYYDLELSEFLYEIPSHRRVLTLEQALETLMAFKQEVREVCKALGEENAMPPGPGQESPADVAAASPAASPSPRRTSIASNSSRESEGSVAGKQAKEEPVRLPWRLVSCLTRALQLIWVVIGVLAVLRETDTLMLDYQENFIVEERRLSTAAWNNELIIDSLEVDWPYGGLFRAQGLHCLPAEITPNGVLVSSKYAHYELRPSSNCSSQSTADSTPSGCLELKEMTRFRVDLGQLVMCTPSGSFCLIGDYKETEDELWLQTLNGGAKVLRLDLHPLGISRRRHHIAGALVSCSMLMASDYDDESLCLVLAASLEDVQIKVGFAELPGHIRSDTGASSRIELLSELTIDLYSNPANPDEVSCGGPIDPPPAKRIRQRSPFITPSSVTPQGHNSSGATQVKPRVTAIHVSPDGRAVWLLMSSGCLQAWDLVNSFRLGRWRLRLPPLALPTSEDEDSMITRKFWKSFEATGVCKLSTAAEKDESLVIAGHSGTSRSPLLFQVNTSVRAVAEVPIVHSVMRNYL